MIITQFECINKVEDLTEEVFKALKNAYPEIEPAESQSKHKIKICAQNNDNTLKSTVAIRFMKKPQNDNIIVEFQK